MTFSFVEDKIGGFYGGASDELLFLK